VLRAHAAELAEVLAVTCHDDAVLGDRAGKDVSVRGTTQAHFVDVHGVEAKVIAQMPG
jgi:hypothetical protein